MARAFGLAIVAVLLGLMAYSAGLAAFVAALVATLGIICAIGWVVSNDWRWPFEFAADICRHIFGR
jgi:hypothetical protein